MEFLGLGLLSRSFLASQDSHACVSRDWLQCGFNNTLMLSGVGHFRRIVTNPQSICLQMRAQWLSVQYKHRDQAWGLGALL